MPETLAAIAFLALGVVLVAALWVWMVLLPAKIWEAEKRAFEEGESAGAERAGIERDRLANLLSGYDVCECGRLRHEHFDLAEFRLSKPADPLESVVEGETIWQTYQRNYPQSSGGGSGEVDLLLPSTVICPPVNGTTC